jgi:glycerophosphoryl diester phosphodiesterase
MRVIILLGIACLIGGVSSTAAIAAVPSATIVPSTDKELIDFRAAARVRLRRPVLVAHRGGIVTAQIPECSLAAIRAASKWGYDAVELDVRRSKDGIPVVFHDNTLRAACGRDGSISDLTAAEARDTRYLKNQETIATLDDALGLCRKLHLGVMLDFKDTRLEADFLQRVRDLVRQHGLDRSTVTISGNPLVRQQLREVVVVPVTTQEIEAISRGESLSLQGLYWFGIPAWINWNTIPKLQQAGALVIPALNTFRYENDADRGKARHDATELLRIGVDGFQIDSAYQDFFGKPLP